MPDAAPDAYLRVTEKVGGALQSFGNDAIKVAGMFDQVAADDATNQLQERANKLFYGDTSTSTLG